MADTYKPPPDPVAATRHALRLSTLSLLWTLVTAAAACALGVVAGSLALVAFGAVGILDAAGSLALIAHFRRMRGSERRSEQSEQSERLAFEVVTVGLLLIGAATTVESVHRLVDGAQASEPLAGVVLVGVCAAVLAALATAKHRIAVHVASPALDADGWVSAVGAGLALVTLVGTGVARTFDLAWVDPAAALVLAVGAMALGLRIRRGARDGRA